MKYAIEQAKLCKIDVPVGWEKKKDGNIISCTYNKREVDNDVTAHAEILAIKDAQKILNTSRLNECELYVTLEPCPMCMWAILQSRISNVYFGSYDYVYGAISTLPQMLNNYKSKLNIKGGIMEKECNELLQNYFNEMRSK